MFLESYNLTELIVFSVCLWLFLQVYFRVATYFNVIDKPNARSSHSRPTIRGGGIIIIAAVLSWFVIYNFQYPWFVLGAVLIATISFADDVRSQHAGLRFIMHLLAFILLLYQVTTTWQLWIVCVTLVVGIGALNAFNFMDGINGITGIYAMVNLASLGYLNHKITGFTNTQLILFVIAGVVIFLIYNFRTVARCFAGDVGSIVLAYVQVFLVLQLVWTTGDFKWVLFFLVYGIDSVVTIVYRLINKENIFKAHRSHLYQYLVNERGYSHLTVSSFYGFFQLIINLVLITSWIHQPFLLVIGITMLYLFVRERTMRQIGKEGVIYKIIKRT